MNLGKIFAAFKRGEVGLFDIVAVKRFDGVADCDCRRCGKVGNFVAERFGGLRRGDFVKNVAVHGVNRACENL